MPTRGQNSLSNFYESVRFHSESTAALMHGDVMIVAIHALGSDKSGGQEATERLREVARARDLPEVFRRMLDNTLEDLGYE